MNMKSQEKTVPRFLQKKRKRSKPIRIKPEKKLKTRKNETQSECALSVEERQRGEVFGDCGTPVKHYGVTLDNVSFQDTRIEDPTHAELEEFVKKHFEYLNEIHHDDYLFDT